MGTTACCCCQLSLGIPIPSSSSISRCKASKTAWWCLSRSRSCGQGSASLHASSTPAHRSTLQDNQTWLNNKIHMSNITSFNMNLLERQRTKKAEQYDWQTHHPAQTLMSYWTFYLRATIMSSLRMWHWLTTWCCQIILRHDWAASHVSCIAQFI